MLTKIIMYLTVSHVIRNLVRLGIFCEIEKKEKLNQTWISCQFQVYVFKDHWRIRVGCPVINCVKNLDEFHLPLMSSVYAISIHEIQCSYISNFMEDFYSSLVLFIVSYQDTFTLWDKRCVAHNVVGVEGS